MSIRKPEFDLHEVFLQRWSPRALSSEPIAHDILMSLFEAAKWAPSSFNNQPWRFVYTYHGSEKFHVLLSVMNPYNHTWAQNASVLILVLSHRFFEKTGEISPSHSFDVGAACQNMALQATFYGLVIHIIEGFDKTLARQQMNIPDDYAIEVLIAVGKPISPLALPEHIQKRECHSLRKPLEELVFKDTFLSVACHKVVQKQDKQ